MAARVQGLAGHIEDMLRALQAAVRSDARCGELPELLSMRQRMDDLREKYGRALAQYRRTQQGYLQGMN